MWFCLFNELFLIDPEKKYRQLNMLVNMKYKTYKI